MVVGNGFGGQGYRIGGICRRLAIRNFEQDFKFSWRDGFRL